MVLSYQFKMCCKTTFNIIFKIYYISNKFLPCNMPNKIFKLIQYIIYQSIFFVYEMFSAVENWLIGLMTQDIYLYKLSKNNYIRICAIFCSWIHMTTFVSTRILGKVMSNSISWENAKTIYINFNMSSRNFFTQWRQDQIRKVIYIFEHCRKLLPIKICFSPFTTYYAHLSKKRDLIFR